MMRAAIHNLGCKVNSYEAEAMEQLLKKAGYDIVTFGEEKADVYIVNTCSVTNIADRKSRQMLHKAKKMNPDSIVVATGCYAQSGADELKLDDSIDIVVGNNKKIDIVTVIETYRKDHERSSNVIDISSAGDYEELQIDNIGEHTRAYIKIQDGCNQFCSYCIIPYARGRVRSRQFNSVLEEVKRLIANGYKEIVLTGIHLSSYGVDLEDVNLLKLILSLHELEGLERIRLGSLEPGIITEEFAETISELYKICPHFHLSLQSGCDETLQRMNRRYNTAEYFEKCEILRRFFAHPAITTDVIVGFPGETEEEFEKTRLFLETINFCEMHIFKYSRRKGTVADTMPEHVDEKIKTKRSNTLITLADKMSKQFREDHLEKTTEVLFEEQVELENISYLLGHTKDYLKVLTPVCDETIINGLYNVKLTGILKDGRMIANSRI